LRHGSICICYRQVFARKHREANQIKQWKDRLLDAVSDVFDDKARASRGPEIDVKSPDGNSLHAKIGQLALENDFLEGALDKAGLLSRCPAGDCEAICREGAQENA